LKNYFTQIGTGSWWQFCNIQMENADLHGKDFVKVVRIYMICLIHVMIVGSYFHSFGFFTTPCIVMRSTNFLDLNGINLLRLYVAARRDSLTPQ